MQKSKSNKIQKKRNPAQKPKRAAARNFSLATVPAAYVPRGMTTGAKMSMQGSSKDGKVLIRNEEYLTDMVCSVNYTVTGFSINPGLQNVFAWLSSIANNYEFYQFKHLKIHYRPIVGTATPGQMMMAMDYDAADSPPSTKQKFLSYMGAVSGPVYSVLTLDLPKVNMEKFAKEKFTRNSAVPAGKDVKTYDLGNLLFASNGGGGASTGSVFLDYAVELSTPHTNTESPSDDSATIYGGAVTRTEPFKATVTQVADTGDPVVAKGLTTDTFILKKAGQYLINFLATGTGITTNDFDTLFSVVADPNSQLANLGTIVNATATGASVYGKIVTSLADRVVHLDCDPYTTLTGQSTRISPFSFSLA